MGPDFVQTLFLLTPGILFGLTVHEYAHARAAEMLGDPTARDLGRVTLNPLAHIDPLGLIMLYIARFGWAKPVPVDPRYFRDPKKDMMLVSLAGPAANLVLAVLVALVLRAGLMNVGTGGLGQAVGYMAFYAVSINVILAVFNLIPIPPLDGSKILLGLLPPEHARALERYERIGPLVLVGLILLGHMSGVSLLWLVIGPVHDGFMSIIVGT